MRIGVVRGDIPGSIFLADLEPSSQLNFPTEPVGQTRYISRPTSVTVGAMLSASIPASLVSTADIVFPVTINAGNQTLKVRAAATDAFTTVLVPTGVYSNVSALVGAVQVALKGTAFEAVVFSATKLALHSKAKGTGARIEVGTLAGGSTFNTPANLALLGANFTVPAASAFIAATFPVGGPLDVRSSTIRTQLGAGLTDAMVNTAADSIAPKFVETDVAIKSFQVGDIAKLLSASYNPDPNRLPAIANGAAIVVVQDDGFTAFTSSVPVVTNAQMNVPVPGALTITGTGLASVGTPNAELVATKVKFLLPVPVTVGQSYIVAAGGTVSASSIVIPASKVPAGVGVGTQVQVQYTSLVSNIFTIV